MPTFLDAAGNPHINEQLLKGVTKLGDRTYKNHLDGYDQMASITGKGESKRHEIFYLGESTLGAVRIDDCKFRFIDQPEGWVGEKTHPDMPVLTNLRLDPYERTAGREAVSRKGPYSTSTGSSLNSGASCSFRDKWPNWPSRLWTIRRCSGVPASTSIA